jgi:uncharacterized protein YdhG (YjbR/CyaY superfamily)
MEYKGVDQFISSFPEHIQVVLQKLRLTILENAPNVKEELICGLPVYKTKSKVLIYFSLTNERIIIYFSPVRYTEYPTEITEHKHINDSVRFRIDKPIHYNLIGQMIKNRVKHYQQQILI